MLASMQKRLKPIKHSVLGDLSSSSTSVAVYVVCVVLALRTSVTQPAIMKRRAGKSYRIRNTSSKMTIDRIVAAMIEVAQFAESRVRLRY